MDRHMLKSIFTMVMLVLFFVSWVLMLIFDRREEVQMDSSESAIYPFSEEEVSANGANEGGDSIHLYSDMWMGAANPGAEMLRCYALMHGKLTRIAEKNEYLLLRYEPPSDDARPEPHPDLDRCPSGTLTVISKIGFEAYREAYEFYFGKGVQ